MESSLQSCAVSRKSNRGKPEVSNNSGSHAPRTPLGLELYREEMALPRPVTGATQRGAGTTMVSLAEAATMEETS